MAYFTLFVNNDFTLLVIHRLGIAKKNSYDKIFHGAYLRTSVLLADKGFALQMLGRHHFFV